MTRQIFYRRATSIAVIFFVAGFAFSPRNVFTQADVESFEAQTIKSAYFDRAMGYKDSSLRVVSLSRAVEQFRPEGDVDALLLECRDDYQGIISLDEVRRYDLQLAIAIELRSEYKAPSWLNPLLIVVPDGGEVPYQERFAAANIRELRFVRLADYYAPLEEISRTAPEREAGYRAFKDNCIFCHSLKGIGGNKGARLMSIYKFSQESERRRFTTKFATVHAKGGSSKQYISQFVTDEILTQIVRFLQDPRF